MRVGGTTEIKVNVRLIAATNRTLLSAVQDGRLRPDLMYRLAVFPIRVPALRERGEDVKLLAHHFLDELNLHGCTNKKFSKQALDKIKSRNWSGNVRELKNYVHRAYILATDKLVFDDEPLFSGRIIVSANGILKFYAGTPLAVAQREIILATLQQFRGNKQITARTLGISLKTLYNRLKEY
jgi:DNA-binding NtrC family response regulator